MLYVPHYSLIGNYFVFDITITLVLAGNLKTNPNPNWRETATHRKHDSTPLCYSRVSNTHLSLVSSSLDPRRNVEMSWSCWPIANLELSVRGSRLLDNQRYVRLSLEAERKCTCGDFHEHGTLRVYITRAGFRSVPLSRPQ